MAKFTIESTGNSLVSKSKETLALPETKFRISMARMCNTVEEQWRSETSEAQDFTCNVVEIG